MKRIKLINTATTLSLFLLLVAGFSVQVSAKSETEKIVAEKTFKVNPDAQLMIDSEFGRLECKNWDKNEISVKIIARIDSDNEDRINKALNRVDYSLSGNSDKVSVTSTLNNKGNNRNNISVDVEVMMPRTVRMNVEHKFGKGYIEEAGGVSKVVSEYGAMTIGSLNALESKIKISFGEGNVGYFGGGNIYIDYSKFNLEETVDADIEAEYSDITIKSARQILLEAEGGDSKIGKVERISGTSEFGSLKIDGLQTALDIRTEYGSLVVKDIHKDFSDIVVKNSFGSAKLFIDDDACYSIDAEAEFGSIDYPESLANLTYREKTTSSVKYKGIIGKDSQARSTIRLSSDYGSINLIAD